MLIKDARHSFRSKIEGAQLLYKIFGKKLEEIEFQLWLVSALKLNDINELVQFLSYSEEQSSAITPTRGYKLLTLSERESAYNFWKINSEISVHRSNGRHLVNISKENILIQVADIEDPNISSVETKRGLKLQAHKRITSKAYLRLHEDFKKLYTSSISYGSFINLKPFYISKPTEKETEMCLCSKCLNPHSLYKAIKTTVDTDLPHSLSEYLCKSIVCPKDPETNFYSRECILGQCKNNCKITCISDDLKNDMAKIKSKKVHYYVFKTVETKYHNKHGKLVTYTRTARVDKNDLIENIAKQLQILAEKYLLHRFFVVNDKCYWKKFLDQTEHYTLWLDYSQNIAFKEKKQA